MYIMPNKKIAVPKTPITKTTLKEAINNRLNSEPVKQITKNQVMRERDENSQSPSKQEGTILQKIEIHQSQKSCGYFGYQNWINFNKQIFQDVQQSVFVNFWKILRIINFGEVLIPNGLIFQISMFLINKRRQNKHQNIYLQFQNLTEIINSFLNKNMKSYSIKNFKQLGNYPSLQAIEDLYCLIEKNDKPLIAKTRIFKEETHNRMFKDAKKRQIQLNAMRYASLLEQNNKYTFSPSINQYTSNFQQKKCDRICYHKRQSQLAKQGTKSEIPSSFKAIQIDNRIYEGDLTSIPGVQEHINRKAYVEAEKNRIQRFKDRPFGKIR